MKPVAIFLLPALFLCSSILAEGGSAKTLRKDDVVPFTEIQLRGLTKNIDDIGSILDKKYSNAKINGYVAELRPVIERLKTLMKEPFPLFFTWAEEGESGIYLVPVAGFGDNGADGLRRSFVIDPRKLKQFEKEPLIAQVFLASQGWLYFNDKATRTLSQNRMESSAAGLKFNLLLEASGSLRDPALQAKGLRQAEIILGDRARWKKHVASLSCLDFDVTDRFDDFRLNTLPRLNKTQAQVPLEFIVKEWDRNSKDLKVLLEHLGKFDLVPAQSVEGQNIFQGYVRIYTFSVMVDDFVRTAHAHFALNEVGEPDRRLNAAKEAVAKVAEELSQFFVKLDADASFRRFFPGARAAAIK